MQIATLNSKKSIAMPTRRQQAAVAKSALTGDIGDDDSTQPGKLRHPSFYSNMLFSNIASLGQNYVAYGLWPDDYHRLLAFALPSRPPG